MRLDEPERRSGFSLGQPCWVATQWGDTCGARAGQRWGREEEGRLCFSCGNAKCLKGYCCVEAFKDVLQNQNL